MNNSITIDVFFVGIATSLIATIVWVVLTQLYDMNGRRKIDYQLEMILDCSRQFEHAIRFSEYYIALAQADRMLDIIGRLVDIIKPLTYRKKKYKLIITYIYNVYYILTIFKNVSIGYEGKQELIARCEKFNRKYMYEVEIGKPVLGEPTTICFLTISFEIVQYLNRYKSVKKALLNNLSIHNYKTKEKNEFYHKLVTRNTYKFGGRKERWYSIYYMRNSVFTEEEYHKYIDRKTKY